MLRRPDLGRLPIYLVGGHALLLRAADHHGHGPALHHLALLRNRDGDAAEFHRLLSAAADAGNPDSLFLRGHCRYYGTDGHDRDAAAAMDDFLGAAGGGNADAMVSAGALLHRGLRGNDGMSVVVERDQRRAFELYQRAGELGSAVTVHGIARRGMMVGLGGEVS